MRRSALAILVLVGCEPTFDRLPSTVDQPMILASRFEPAESMPGQSVDVEILAIDPWDVARSARVVLRRCERPPATDDGTAIAQECVAGLPATQPIEAMPLDPFDLEIPTDACQVFGSESPPAAPGEPAPRPRDPDPSGGYYQPFRVDYLGDVAVFRHRVRCALAAAPVSIARDFRERYSPNQNPRIAELAGPIMVRAGERRRLSLRLEEAAVEDYVVYAGGDGLQTRREELIVDWYVTVGELTIAREGLTTGATNTWQAPAATSTATLISVVRDDRGGTDWASLTIRVLAAAE